MIPLQKLCPNKNKLALIWICVTQGNHCALIIAIGSRTPPLPVQDFNWLLMSPATSGILAIYTIWDIVTVRLKHTHIHIHAYAHINARTRTNPPHPYIYIYIYIYTLTYNANNNINIWYTSLIFVDYICLVT